MHVVDTFFLFSFFPFSPSRRATWSLAGADKLHKIFRKKETKQYHLNCEWRCSDNKILHFEMVNCKCEKIYGDASDPFTVFRQRKNLHKLPILVCQTGQILQTVTVLFIYNVGWRASVCSSSSRYLLSEQRNRVRQVGAVALFSHTHEPRALLLSIHCYRYLPLKKQ